MKVAEKNSDRSAEVHLYVEGSTEALDEFNEYIDTADGAINCFVPIDLNNKVRVGGRFDGTTQTVHYDVLVDGVCRKSNAFIGKTVTMQKNKKLDVDKFLFQTNDGIVDSPIKTTSIATDVEFVEKGPASLGIMELRLYVLRRHGDSHALRDVPIYLEQKGEGHDTENPVGYSKLKPEFTMAYDKESAILDDKDASRNRKKVEGKRPGNEPWAIFRFHYRTREAIKKMDMKQTFNAKSKAKTEPTTLDIPVLPMFTVLSKPKKTGDGEDVSTRQSSQAASVSEAPPKVRDITDEVESPATKQQPTSTSKTAPQPRERSPNPTSTDPFEKDREQVARMFQGPPSAAVILQQAMALAAAPASAVDSEKAKEQVQKPTTSDATNGTTKEKPNDDKDEAQKSSEAAKATIPVKPIRPEPIVTTLLAPILPKEPVTPTKRARDLTPPHTPEVKRVKVTPDATSITAPPFPTITPTPRFLSPASESLERKLAELRRRRENVKKDRITIAKRLEVIEERLAPFKQRMKEEFARLEEEVAAEEAAKQQDEVELGHRVAMLREFQSDER